MPIRIVTKEVRYIHKLSLTLEDSMSISSPTVPGLAVTASREAPVFDVYPDPVESSNGSLDRITNVLAKIQLKSCRSHTLAELLDNHQEVASIDDLPFQHGTSLATERETGSGETVLADCESDLESFSPERLVPMIIHQAGGAPSQHDPNEALDQISEDNLTRHAP